MGVLERINCSADVTALDEAELPVLCEELRAEIIETVSRSGGHLASNLGAVELTVALHRVYDTARDRVVFDVGHQCYAHKLLTGRRERFSTLRQKDGLAGFPRPGEARDDACVCGHASVSISEALGMARARTLLGEKHAVAAVIGDGALTGGTAYEGLADCGGSGEAMVVVLNDNAMSIAPNVGGMARLLAKARLKPGYLRFKRFYRRTVGRHERLYGVLHKCKEWVKDLFLPDNMFEDMGFYYLGPVDGHDLKGLTRALEYARELQKPVLLHVRTVKGRGYPPAEADPAAFHSVGPFDPAAGKAGSGEIGFSQAFGGALVDAAEREERIVAVTAAMADGTGLVPFARRFPGRFFDVGIAEGHAAAMCAGMARNGALIPVFAVYSSFLQRSFDMLMQDVALSGEHVVLAVDRAGLVGADGATHQGAFDVGYLRMVPGLKLWAPASFAELRSMLDQALDAKGPAALRYPRGGEGAFRDDTSDKSAAILRAGFDVTVVTYGILVNEALKAAEKLETRGVSVELVKLNRLDAPDFDLIAASAGKTGAVFVAEDCAERGCLGTEIAAELRRRNIPAARLALANLGNGVVAHGSVAELYRALGLDTEGMARAVEVLVREKTKA